jgi:hypothetical protein
MGNTEVFQFQLGRHSALALIPHHTTACMGLRLPTTPSHTSTLMPPFRDCHGYQIPLSIPLLGPDMLDSRVRWFGPILIPPLSVYLSVSLTLLASVSFQQSLVWGDGQYHALGQIGCDMAGSISQRSSPDGGVFLGLTIRGFVLWLVCDTSNLIDLVSIYSRPHCLPSRHLSSRNSTGALQWTWRWCVNPDNSPGHQTGWIHTETGTVLFSLHIACDLCYEPWDPHLHGSPFPLVVLDSFILSFFWEINLLVLSLLPLRIIAKKLRSQKLKK